MAGIAALHGGVDGGVSESAPLAMTDGAKGSPRKGGCPGVALMAGIAALHGGVDQDDHSRIVVGDAQY